MTEDILVRAMNGFMGCCDCDGNRSAFQECGMEISRLRFEVERLNKENAELQAMLRDRLQAIFAAPEAVE